MSIIYKEKIFCSIIKRAFDIIASSTFLLFFGWFILLIVFIKFCENLHNPVYTSIRTGKDGKLTKFHKIRSMKPNADINEADGPAFKMEDDSRITKFGKCIRKISIDELLQIWDIFVRILSVVGPRNPLPSEVSEHTYYKKQKLLVKGGLLCFFANST